MAHFVRLYCQSCPSLLQVVVVGKQEKFGGTDDSHLKQLPSLRAIGIEGIIGESGLTTMLTAIL